MSYLDNLTNIKQQIALAEEHASRPSKSVKLIAVSKTVTVEAIKELLEGGQLDFAENRAQVLRDKNKVLGSENVNWHFIGPLQSNKLKYVYPIAKLVHSIDREELLEQFIKWAKKTDHLCPCLLEVHISEEDSKQGFSPEEVIRVIDKYKDNENLNIVGLMGMAPFTSDEEIVRGCFKKLKKIFEESKKHSGIAYQAKELSMGMTNDFKIAIEEGATMVRIGSAIFNN
jgi:pyridoxal phosphate enzyme (YggS family)